MPITFSLIYVIHFSYNVNLGAHYLDAHYQKGEVKFLENLPMCEKGISWD